jgi:CheY-like chemotaxis protein
MPDQPTPTPEVPVTPKNKKVLFVDDDTFLLDMYAVKFTKGGYEVKTADSPDAAIKLMQGGYHPDVILADIVMPGMDGLEFVDSIKRDNLAPASTIIMLTNQGASDDISKAKKLGVDGYIVKATTIPSEVLDYVEKLSAGKRSP